MGRAGSLAVLLPALVLALVSSACDGDPFEFIWFADPDTVVLYSLARPELNRLSAFNFNQRSRVHIEATGATGSGTWRWTREAGQLVLLTPDALGITSLARIAVLHGMTFDQVEEAPADTLVYSVVQPVPVQLGSVYVVRTDARSVSLGGLSLGGRCSYYAKLEPLALDVPEGMMEFVFDASPVCNDRRLIPRDTGS